MLVTIYADYGNSVKFLNSSPVMGHRIPNGGYMSLNRGTLLEQTNSAKAVPAIHSRVSKCHLPNARYPKPQTLTLKLINPKPLVKLKHVELSRT